MSDEAKIFGIKQWAEDDRPREKLIRKGKSALSDSELLAILISTGTKSDTAFDLAQKVLVMVGNNLNELGKLTIKDLQKVKGIGQTKAITITAALELGRRRKEAEAVQRGTILSSKDAYAFFEPTLSDIKQEEFWVLLLNRSNKILSAKRISEGGIAGTVADPKVIFKYALDELASTIILCHNHPSGSVKPSQADISLTRKIKEAGTLLEVVVADHLIIGDKSYFSFADEGLLHG